MKIQNILIILLTLAASASAQIPVGNEDALRNAISNGACIRLTNDIQMGSILSIPSGVKVTIDLNGHTLSRSPEDSNDDDIIYVSSDTVTSIVGGKIIGGGIYIQNGTLTISGKSSHPTTQPLSNPATQQPSHPATQPPSHSATLEVYDIVGRHISTSLIGVKDSINPQNIGITHTGVYLLRFGETIEKIIIN